MGKRPSIVGDLSLEPARPARRRTVKPAPAPEPPAAEPPKPKVEVQHTSVYIPRPVYERLREIAFHERLKIHDLIMQGLDLVMIERGHPERTKDP
jgi:hypothetical protein